jgi:hypothetical protein
VTTSRTAGRASDFLLLAGGGAALALSALFTAARIWFRPIFIAATGHEPLMFALPLAAAAVALGVAYTLKKEKA